MSGAGRDYWATLPLISHGLQHGDTVRGMTDSIVPIHPLVFMLYAYISLFKKGSFCVCCVTGWSDGAECDTPLQEEVRHHLTI